VGNNNLERLEFFYCSLIFEWFEACVCMYHNSGIYTPDKAVDICQMPLAMEIRKVRNFVIEIALLSGLKLSSVSNIKAIF
jgi:hypothetical protein